jgi:hypothetical protein
MRSMLITGMARMYELCWEEAKRRNKEDLFSSRKGFLKINTGKSVIKKVSNQHFDYLTNRIILNSK